MANRNRSRSGAQTECPHCGRKLRGEKGLAMHIAQEHGADEAAPGETREGGTMIRPVMDLPTAVVVVERAVAGHRAATAGLTAVKDYDRWRAAHNEADGTAKQTLERAGAVIPENLRDASIRLAGVRSTSTGGLIGAMSNWLTAARKRLAAAEDPFNPHGSGPVPIKKRKEAS